MKTIKKIAAFFAVILCVYPIVSCGSDESWSPGPKASENNPGVYFSSSNPKVTEMESTQTSITLTLGRDEAKASAALEVPVTVRYADSNLSIPSTVFFAAGAQYAELIIGVNDFEFRTSYRYSVEVSEEYGDPYSSTQKGGVRFDGTVEVVLVLATTTFTPTDYSGTTQPEFIPFIQTIYDNMDGTYTIKNFLHNNAGYSFTFAIDEDNNIIPDSNCGYHAVDDNRWFFYSANENASSYRIPCYIPGNNKEDYIAYIYFYTKDNTSSYQAFQLDIANKTGRMMGYSRYSVSSSGRIAFDIVWD